MKKNLGRKKSRSYAMKGGAGPYVYEGVRLALDNPYTHFAVNSNDDGSYNFNIPKIKNFTSFCELYQYYQQYSPISCVHQEFTGKDGNRYKAPSFVDILGIALVLRKIQTSDRTRILSVNDKVLTEAFKMLSVIASGGQPLCWEEVGTLHINSYLQKKILEELQTRLPSLDYQDVNFMSIESLSKLDIDAVLRLFKQAIFYYRYGVINSDASNLLTFERMLTPKDAKTLLTLDPAAIQTFDNNSKQENWFSKISLYTNTPLELALEIQADEPARAQRQAEDITRNRERLYNKFFKSEDGFDSFNKTYSDVSEGSDEFKRIRRKLLQIQDKMLAFGAEPSDGGLLIQSLDTPAKIKLQEEYNELRKAAIENRGGRGRGTIRVKRTNKNRRMRTRRSRTRRTRRRY